jgi:hypothetical protein
LVFLIVLVMYGSGVPLAGRNIFLIILIKMNGRQIILRGKTFEHCGAARGITRQRSPVADTALSFNPLVGRNGEAFGWFLPFDLCLKQPVSVTRMPMASWFRRTKINYPEP